MRVSCCQQLQSIRTLTSQQQQKHSMLICLKRNCQTVGFECYQRHFQIGCCQTQNKHKTFKTVSENAIKDILKQGGIKNRTNRILSKQCSRMLSESQFECCQRQSVWMLSETVTLNAVRDSHFECCQRRSVWMLSETVSLNAVRESVWMLSETVSLNAVRDSQFECCQRQYEHNSYKNNNIVLNGYQRLYWNIKDSQLQWIRLMWKKDGELDIKDWALAIRDCEW